jgi:hypothetical protein
VQRFSRRNVLGWIAGAASLVVALGVQAGIFEWRVWAVIGAAALVVVAYFLFRIREQSRHARRLREFAEQHGWTYRPDGNELLIGLTGFPFGTGTSRAAMDVVEGTYSGVSVSSYTYSFDQKVAGEYAGEQVFTVTQAQLPARLPRLDLVPEDMGTRVLSQFGLADIDLESAEFNRTWRVLCADKRFAIDVVDPRMMLALMRNRQQGVAVRLDGDKVIAWSAGVAQVRDMARRMDLVASVSKGVPAHVVRKYAELDAQRRAEEAAREANAPGWAKAGGVLNSGRYTGIGVDADGDGVDDWEQRNR